MCLNSNIARALSWELAESSREEGRKGVRVNESVPIIRVE